MDNVILIGALLLFISLLASRTSRYGVPTLLLFLAIGMLAGSDGIGGIHFDDTHLARFIGSVALTFILFSGGLDTKYNDIKPVLKEGIILSTLGVLLTCFIVGFLIVLFTDFSILEGLLLGAIVSSTDAAAVFSLLRSKSLGLKGNLRPLLELESGSNDPMAYFLTIIFTYLLANQEANYSSLIPMFFQQMVIGAIFGYSMGILMQKVINWIKLEYDGLYSVLLISMVLITLSVSEFLGGNPYLAIYISGCILGNRDFVHKKSLMKHFDGQAWLMQIVMFLTLGLLVFPTQIVPYIGIGLIFSFILIFVARPLSVFIVLSFFKFNFRKKLFISWVGIRGAVPIILAIFPLTTGIDKANIIFNLVFFVSVTSVLVQGTSIPLVANWLNLSVPVNLMKKSEFDLEMAWKTKSINKNITIEESAKCIGRSIVELSLPSSIIIALIERNGKFIIPDGTTQLLIGDRLTVLADYESDIERLQQDPLGLKPGIDPSNKTF